MSVGPPTPKLTWADKVAVKPKEDEFTKVGRQGSEPQGRNREEGSITGGANAAQGTDPGRPAHVSVQQEGSARSHHAGSAGQDYERHQLGVIHGRQNTHIRVEQVRCSPKGTITVSAAMGCLVLRRIVGELY